MAKKSNDMVVDALAINYARIASPVAKYETDGKQPEELEWKADLLIDEETVDKIKEQYPNLRKKMNPITSKKYKEIYKVDMPKDVEGPHILKLTMDFAVKFNDPKKGETVFYKPQPKVLLSQGKKKAKEITFDEYIGNGSVGRVIIKHRSTKYNSKDIDVLELGSVLLTELVEVEQKPGQGGNQEDDVEDAFGLDEVEESETEAPERNEKGINSSDDDDSADDFDDEEEDM